MAMRPAKCYKKLERPYTRQSRKKPRKGYVKGVPASKITKFESGNKKKKFPLKLTLVSKEEAQVRSNALESLRIAANKIMTDNVGVENFMLKILIVPYHVLRENTLATGAGADRYQTGMKKAYGKPIGIAARIKKDQRLITISTIKERRDVAKRALKVAASKLPVPSRVVEN
ncbi:MAG: 50S ribosomal protein L16 [Candidatus Aenigmarchaeota archaeon]|nr:50S ribosomal protein L16 [Candidatus Aenigmarchaeota archaeon]